MKNNTIIGQENYSLFIDDERFPPDNKKAPYGDWMICRSVEEAKDTIITHGIPKHISFDHDLGDNTPTGYELAKWLTEEDMNGYLSIINLTYYVHSANPVGKKNIEGLLNNYLSFISHHSLKEQQNIKDKKSSQKRQL